MASERCRAGACNISLGSNEGKRETVISLAAHGLNHRGAHPWLGGQHVVETANSLHSRIVARGVHDGSIPHDVVDDDHAARTRKPQRPREVLWNALFVGINEDRIERA